MENRFMCKQYISFFLFIFSIHSVILIEDQNNTEQLVKDLEIQKDNLYEKIQDTINKSIDSLSNKTDRGAISVLESIKELRKNVEKEKLPEEISKEIEIEINKLINDTLNSSKMRRRLKSRRQFDKDSRREQTDQLIQEMRLELFAKHKGNKKFADLDKAKHNKFLKMMQDRIKIFLDDRDSEYKIIFNKTKRHSFTKCPRYGFLKKSRERVQYPCCRKCCKASYMGCL